MLTKITVFDVENILLNQFNMDIRLNELIFYKSQSEHGFTIFCTNTEEIRDNFRIYPETESVGIPIIKLEKNHVSVLPPIINLISNTYDSYQMDRNFLVSISFGKAVKLLKPNSFCFIVNNRGDKISFGKIEDNMFIPFIDLGWYLRQGT